jgi:hypothetical protein
MRWCPSIIVPSGFTLSAPGSPGCNESINFSVESFRKVINFGWLNEPSACSDFSEPFSTLSFLSHLALTRASDVSGRSVRTRGTSFRIVGKRYVLFRNPRKTRRGGQAGSGRIARGRYIRTRRNAIPETGLSP